MAPNSVDQYHPINGAVFFSRSGPPAACHGYGGGDQAPKWEKPFEKKVTWQFVVARLPADLADWQARIIQPQPQRTASLAA